MNENIEQIIRESLDTYLNFGHELCILKLNKPHLKNKYQECLRLDSFFDFAICCTELINITVLEREQYINQQKLHLQYWKVFNDIPQPKDELVSFLLLSVWFLVHSTLFKISDQKKIDQQFLFNSYHVLIFYINGIYVSDEFITQQIEIYFQKNYLDYRLNSFQRRTLKKLQLQSSGNMIFKETPLPDLSTLQGGAQFQKDIKIKKQQQRKQQNEQFDLFSGSQTERNQNYTNRRFPQSIKFNLNQLSPSIRQLLNLDNRSTPKARLITHQIYSPQVKNTKILTSIKEQKIITTQIINKEKCQRLLDRYKITQPSTEYFKKHPKIDHLFKDMLETKLILQQTHQQVKGQPWIIKEDSNLLREKLTQYLEERPNIQQEDNNNNNNNFSPFGSMLITHQRTPSDTMRETYTQSRISHTMSKQPSISQFIYHKKLLASEQPTKTIMK